MISCECTLIDEEYSKRGVLELSGNKLIFSVSKGFLRKKKVIVREISLSDIIDVKYSNARLIISWMGAYTFREVFVAEKEKQEKLNKLANLLEETLRKLKEEESKIKERQRKELERKVKEKKRHVGQFLWPPLYFFLTLISIVETFLCLFSPLTSTSTVSLSSFGGSITMLPGAYLSLRIMAVSTALEMARPLAFRTISFALPSCIIAART